MEDSILLAAVREQPRATTREIADIVGIGERAADHRLRALYAEGKVQSRTIGNALIWIPLEDPAAEPKGTVAVSDT